MVRLLYIRSARDPRRRLSCYSRSFNLDHAPPYEALSYVWGYDNFSTRSSILFNKQVVTVGSNLADALTRLRLPNITRILWVDALCINQKDEEEKNHQVPLMSSIYSLARRTVVWLGHGDPQTIRNVTKCIQYIADACRQYACTHALGWGARNRYNPLMLPVALFSDEVCYGLNQLYNLRWFWRVWCVQEICLAQDATVYWGEAEVAWSDIGLATSWMSDKRLANQQSDPIVELLKSVPCVIAEMMSLASNIQAPLLDVLQKFRARQCSDIRDKVYGLLGLVDEEEANAIVVDYSKSVGEVYADTVLATIRLGSRLTALGDVSHPENYIKVEGIPSWAPCWNDWNPVVRIGLSDKICPWSACAGQYVRCTDVHDMGPTRLLLTGISYSTVTVVQDTMCGLETYNGQSQHSFVTALIAVLGIEDSIESRHRLARTFTTGQSDENYVQNLDVHRQSTFYRSFGTFMSTLSRKRAQRDLRANGLDGAESASTIFREDAYLYCSDRRVFFTEEGSYGLGPRCMLPGDIVVVLYGGNTPYVLRPKANEFLFMGQAYVDEIMNGELVHEVEAGKRQEQRFCLV